MSAVASESAGSKKVLRFAAAEKIEFHHVAAEVVKKAYARAGYEAKIDFFPVPRSLQMSSTGKYDGELVRVWAIGEKFKTLKRIPTPYLNFYANAFFIDDKVRIRTSADLANYTVGIVRGALYAERLTEGMDVISVTNVSQLFEMLIRKRFDVFVLSEFTGLFELYRNFPDAGIKYTRHLEEYPVYHYLHEKNRHIIPRLDKVLQDMVSSGEITKIREDFLARRLPKKR